MEVSSMGAARGYRACGAASQDAECKKWGCYIAEGFGRSLPDDFARHLRLANGALKETVDARQDAGDPRCLRNLQNPRHLWNP